MTRKPITHLIIDTSSSDEDDNGGCDYCLVEMTAEYVAYLLGYMEEVRRLHRSDMAVYAIECWDAGAAYFRFNERFRSLRDIDGDVLMDVPRGEPILLTADPRFAEADHAQVDCRTVQVSKDDAWWTAYVKHTDIRIESAHVPVKTLLRIQRSCGGAGKPRKPDKARPVDPAIRKIHDLLYLDERGGRQFYNPNKARDAGTLAMIAEVVAEHIPKPKEH